MASTYTSNLSLEIPGHGDYASTGWDNPMNNSLRALDTAYGGQLSLSLSGGTRQLTTTEASNPFLYLYGTLSSDQFLYFPRIAGRRIITQNVALNGHVLYVRGNNGADTIGIYFWVQFGIPYPIMVMPDRVCWDYGGAQPGTIVDMATAFAGNGWLPCDGRWVNMGLHDLLYYTIGATFGVSGSFPSGSFRMPDYRGTVLAMADNLGAVPSAGPYSQNTGNRGILNSWGLTTTNYGGEATHQISVAEMPGHNHPGTIDSGHWHQEQSHTHGSNIVRFVGSGGNLGVYTPGAANASYTASGGNVDYTAPPNTYNGVANITVGSQGGWVAHNNVQPTCTTMKMIKW